MKSELESPNSYYVIVKRSLKESYDMGDPKVGPMGEDNGRYQFLVTYGESDTKFLYKRIKISKPTSDLRQAGEDKNNLRNDDESK